MYFAIFNPSLSPLKAHFTIDAKAMGLSRIAKITAYFCAQKQVGTAPAGEGRYRISIEVPSLRLVVLEAGTDDVGDPDAIVDYYPSKHRAWQAEAAKPRLVGQWNLDEGAGQQAKDSSGGNAHAVLGSGPKPEDADPKWVDEGHTGTALRFDGVDDLVTVRHVEALRIRSAFAIEAWIKRARRTTHARVVDLSGTCMYFEGDGDRVGLRIGGYSVNTAWSTPIPLNEWAHLKATYDGKTISMYVNGNLCETKAFECARPLRGGAMTIGNAGTMQRPFAGLIDEVRIYNYVK